MFNGDQIEAFVSSAQPRFTITSIVITAFRSIMTRRMEMSVTGSSGFNANPVINGKSSFDSRIFLTS